MSDDTPSAADTPNLPDTPASASAEPDTPFSDAALAADASDADASAVAAPPDDDGANPLGGAMKHMALAPPPPPSKKSKKKNSNSVWTRPNSRKGKKKAKQPANALAGGSAGANGRLPKPSNGDDELVLTPAPRFAAERNDDAPDLPVLLSRVFKSDKVEVSDDRLTAGSTKGYRMVRATRGVAAGAWYFEVKQQEARNDGLDAQATKDNISGNNNRDFEQYGVINTFTQLFMRLMLTETHELPDGMHALVAAWSNGIHALFCFVIVIMFQIPYNKHVESLHYRGGGGVDVHVSRWIVLDGGYYLTARWCLHGVKAEDPNPHQQNYADIHAPVGYYVFGFGYRDMDGTKVHKAWRSNYADQGYGEGDVLGFYIHLPDGELYEPKQPFLVHYKGLPFRAEAPKAAEQKTPDPVPGEYHCVTSCV
uniref:B30.2/SPRY domain-containing protein n=1 Tax=Oryza barthii TaxID=65489 RepID=A0A0D3HI50_9ORYZ